MTASLLFALLVQNDVKPQEIRTHATIHSIGIEWDLLGDADHDATCAVSFRGAGSERWREALPLFRVDYEGWYGDEKADRAYNMFAGSLLFLEPDTTYELRLTVADPGGGMLGKTLKVRTRPVPAPPKGRTLHVVPGAGGGRGTAEDPFKGLEIAKGEARGGDTILLHRGNYGSFFFNRTGKPGEYVVWKAAGDGDAIFESAEVQSSHTWLEGLEFRHSGAHNALKVRGDSKDVVIVRNRFTGYPYSIVLTEKCSDSYIADNSIVGDRDPVTGGLSGEGVELNHSSGHVVCFNRISQVADGVSYPSRNCDIYGNDIFDVSDDGVEPDYGYANNRIWGNRLTNCRNASITFQPMHCGPWYILRNQMVCRGESLKFRVQDRFLFAHNTVVQWGPASSYMHHLLTGLSRNNLFISAGGRRPLWVAQDGDGRHVLPPAYSPTWKADVDHDGFDWGEAPEAFRWDHGRRRFAGLEEFAKALGIEAHGLRVRKEEIFETWKIPAQDAAIERAHFTLKAGGAAVDAGAVLPGLNDGFDGKAPDLGALELGKPPPHYGPRP